MYPSLSLSLSLPEIKRKKEHGGGFVFFTSDASEIKGKKMWLMFFTSDASEICQKVGRSRWER